MYQRLSNSDYFPVKSRQIQMKINLTKHLTQLPENLQLPDCMESSPFQLRVCLMCIVQTGPRFSCSPVR